VTLFLAAISLRTGVKYVAAAYAVVWGLTLLYVWIIGSKLRRMEGELDEAERQLAERRSETRAGRDERVSV
jgi:CcmD family protein